MNGVEMVHAADLSIAGANQICFGPSHNLKTVAEHQVEKGREIHHASLPCIAIRRSKNHFDFFPLEVVYFVTI